MMLILTRRLNESIVIDSDVIVRVIGVKGGQVRLGVTAPKQVIVHREEVYRRILKEQGGNAHRGSPLATR